MSTSGVDGPGGATTRRDKTTQVFIEMLQSEYATDKQVDKYCKRCVDFIDDKCKRKYDAQRREPAQLEELLLCVAEVLAQIMGMQSLRASRSKSSTKAMSKSVDSVVELLLKELRCLQQKQVQAVGQAQEAGQAELQLQLLGGGLVAGEELVDLTLLSSAEWASHTWRRLELLKTVLHTSGRTLTLAQVEEVWRILNAPVARESCCRWFRLSFLPTNATQPNSPTASAVSPATSSPTSSSMLNSVASPLVDIEVCHHIFAKLMCDDMMTLASSIGVEGYLSFRAFFLVLNQEQRRLQLSQPFVASTSNQLELDGSTSNSLAVDDSSSGTITTGSVVNVRRVLRAPLLGLDALWKLVLYAPNESIAASATHFLVALQLAPSDTGATSPAGVAAAPPPPPQLARSPSQSSPSSSFLNQVFEELLQVTEKLKQWQHTNTAGQRGLLLLARRCVALLHAALQHQHHPRGGQRQLHQWEDAQLLPPHGAMAQGWQCELVIRFTFQPGDNGFFSHGMGSQKIAPDGFQSTSNTSSDQAQTIRLEAHSNHTVGQVRQFVGEWIRAEESVAKKRQAAATRSGNNKDRARQAAGLGDPQELVSSTSPSVTLRRRDGSELHAREDHKRLVSVNLGTVAGGSGGDGGGGGGSEAGRAGSTGNVSWEITVERPATEEWNSVNGVASDVRMGSPTGAHQRQGRVRQDNPHGLESVGDDGQNMNKQENMQHGAHSLDDLRELTVDTGSSAGFNALSEAAGAADTTPLAWCGALMASKRTLFECLFTLLGVIAEFPDSESDAHIVGLEQRVWQLLLLIPTNKEQMAMFLESPTEVNWRQELTTGTFARQVYSLQLVEQLANPARLLQLCMLEQGLEQESKVPERSESSDQASAVEPPVPSANKVEWRYISSHDADRWRRDFMRSEHGFESAIDFLEQLMSEQSGAEAHQGADGFVGEGFWAVDGVAVVLRVIQVCVADVFGTSSQNSAATAGQGQEMSRGPRLALDNPLRLLILLVQAVSRVHHMTKSRLARRRRLASASASSSASASFTPGQKTLSSSSFTAAESHEPNSAMAGARGAHGARVSATESDAETAELDERIDQLLHMALDTISCIRALTKLHPFLLEAMAGKGLTGRGGGGNSGGGSGATVQQNENGLDVSFALLLEHHALEVRQAASQMLVEMVQMCQPQSVESSDGFSGSTGVVQGSAVSVELSTLVHRCMIVQLLGTLKRLPPSGESAQTMPAGQADEFFAVFERLLHILFPTAGAEDDAEGEAGRLLNLLVSNLLALDDSRGRGGGSGGSGGGSLKGASESKQEEVQEEGGWRAHGGGNSYKGLGVSRKQARHDINRQHILSGWLVLLSALLQRCGPKVHAWVGLGKDAGGREGGLVGLVMRRLLFSVPSIRAKGCLPLCTQQIARSSAFELLGTLSQGSCAANLQALVSIFEGMIMESLGGAGGGALSAELSAEGDANLAAVLKGDRVWYNGQEGTVSLIYTDGTCRIRLDDGTTYKRVSFSDLGSGPVKVAKSVVSTFTFSDVQRSILLHDFGQPDAPRSEAGYVGLKNLGCTCYINSVLQQLFCTKPFRACILEVDAGFAKVEETGVGEQGVEVAGSGTGAEAGMSAEPKDGGLGVGGELEQAEGKGSGSGAVSESKDVVESEEQGNRKLMLELQRAFTFLLESTRQHYDPTKLVHSCKVLPLEFPVLHQNDAAEFCDGLVDKLKDMLKAMQQQASQVHFETLNSLFRVQMCYQNIRQPCQHMTERFDDQVSVKLEIKGKSSIMESLKAFVEGELMEGDNALECEGCDNAKRDTRRRTCFTKLPNVLIFNLKRFVFNMNTFETEKINDRCEFPVVLDMRPFTKEGLEERDRDAMASSGRQTSPVARKQSSPVGRMGALGFDSGEHQYALSGIVVHSGGAHAGHYYSIIRCDDDDADGEDEEDEDGGEGGEGSGSKGYSTNPMAHRWLRFDDTNVKEFDMTTLEAECFGGETTRLVREPSYPHRQYEQPAPIEKNAFLLFYQRIDHTTGSPTTPTQTAAAAFAAAAMASPASASTLAAMGQQQQVDTRAALVPNNTSRHELHTTHHRLIQPCPPHLAPYETQVWRENMRQVRRQQFYDDELLYFMEELLRTRGAAARTELHGTARAENDARLASLGSAFLFGPVLLAEKRVRLEKQRGKTVPTVGRTGSTQGSMTRATAYQWVKYLGTLCKSQPSLAPTKELLRQLVKTPQVELMLLWQDEQQWRCVCAELLLALATCCYADPAERQLLTECTHEVLLAVTVPPTGAATDGTTETDLVGPPPSALGEMLSHLLRMVPTLPPARAHEFHSLEQLLVLLRAIFLQMPLLLHTARAHSVIERHVLLFLSSKEHNLTGSVGVGFTSNAPLATVATGTNGGHGHGSSMAMADEVPRVFLNYKPLLELIATLATERLSPPQPPADADSAASAGDGAFDAYFLAVQAAAAAAAAASSAEKGSTMTADGELSSLPASSKEVISSPKFLEMALDEMTHGADSEAGLRVGMYNTPTGCSAAAGGRWNYDHAGNWAWFSSTGSEGIESIPANPELLQQPAVRIMTSLCRSNWETSCKMMTFLIEYVRFPTAGHAELMHTQRGVDFKNSVSLALRTILSMDDEHYNQRMQLVLTNHDKGLLDQRRTHKARATGAADRAAAGGVAAARGRTVNNRSLLSVARFILELSRTHGLARRWLLTPRCMRALRDMVETVHARQQAAQQQQQRRQSKHRLYSELQELHRIQVYHLATIKEVRRRAGAKGVVTGAPREQAAGGCGLGPVPRVLVSAESAYCRISGAGENLVNGRYLPSQMFSSSCMFSKQVGPMKLSIIRCVMKSGAKHWFISRCEDPPGTSKDVDFYHNVKESETPPTVGLHSTLTHHSHHTLTHHSPHSHLPPHSYLCVALRCLFIAGGLAGSPGSPGDRAEPHD
jgi:ubiquitin C-terminal hydrolase